MHMHTTKPVSIGRIVPDKTETHVESIPANVFSRELLRPISSGVREQTLHRAYIENPGTDHFLIGGRVSNSVNTIDKQ